MLSNDRCGTKAEMQISLCNGAVWVEMVAADQ